MKAIKKLGQHFLLNKEKLAKIVAAADLKAGDVVIEIGPGHGELTDELRIKNKEVRIITIEKDEKLANFLKEKFGKDKNIEIITGDVLKILPSLIHDSRFMLHDYKLVGNIPYYLTGYLFRLVSGLKHKPSLIVFVIQKEVAERIYAQPREMNLLAASIQYWAEPEIIDFISKSDFEPQPEVDGAIIRLKVYDERFKPEEIKKYYDFLHVLFRQPRKTIANNLKSAGMPNDKILQKLADMGIAPRARPQDLKTQEIVELSTSF